jgi:hypothetical protein
MGGGNKNPLKQIVNAAADIAVAPIRETARAVGADGIVRGADDVKNFGSSVGNGIIDLANNEKGKQQKKADEASAVEEKKNAAVAADASAKQQADAFAASESARMSAGSKSRTLLTGPSGLEDEDGVTISRKTLKAR